MKIGKVLVMIFDRKQVSGITIGDGAVIASRAIVTKNVAPYEMVGSNPARHIRFRFSAEEIEMLLTMKWWHWTDQEIQDAMPFM